MIGVCFTLELRQVDGHDDGRSILPELGRGRINSFHVLIRFGELGQVNGGDAVRKFKPGP